MFIRLPNFCGGLFVVQFRVKQRAKGEKPMLNKKEFIQAMADYGNVSQKDARKSLYLFIDTLTDVLDSGETVKIMGLGKFKVKKTKESFLYTLNRSID